jgi:hypothetical protein
VVVHALEDTTFCVQSVLYKNQQHFIIHNINREPTATDSGFWINHYQHVQDLQEGVMHNNGSNITQD